MIAGTKTEGGFLWVRGVSVKKCEGRRRWKMEERRFVNEWSINLSKIVVLFKKGLDEKILLIIELDDVKWVVKSAKKEMNM